jgi:hypothetical protein
VGTVVNIVHEPYKAGWADGYLWLESHPPLEDYRAGGADYSLNQLMTITQNATKNLPAEVDWALAKQFYTHSRGVPMVIGTLGK